MKSLVFTVTNDLSFDQRMHRICNSLALAGYQVTLVGRKMPRSRPLVQLSFKQKRLNCFFTKGKLMYAAFNLRLFFYLLFSKADLFCAIDLDTILPVYFASRIKRIKRVYDAHELFTEQKEIVTRPAIQKMWLKIEKFAVPKYSHGYSVNNFIVEELQRRYGVKYSIVRNLPRCTFLPDKQTADPPFIIYQGAVNEGRSFETLVPAMLEVNAKLVVCGEGNFYEKLKDLITKHNAKNKIELKGYVSPTDLAALTPRAHIAVMLFENTGLNQYYSLANRFFDYITAGVPQVCVDFPEYRAINDVYKIAYMIPDTHSQTIANALNNLLKDAVLYDNLKENCLKAREFLNWENEEKVLLSFYKLLW
ncbi:MAG: glycosyltransferase [Chitinophagaceae bacterium]|nr:glycosyltransferase [Chitinophagaceae bacterium]